MKERIKNSVSEIVLSQESKSRILADVKRCKTSGKIKAPVIRYVSVAAIFCVLAASAAIVSVYVSGQNKPGFYDNSQTVQDTGDHTQKSEILTEGGQKVYDGAYIGNVEENSVTSAYEQSMTETAPNSGNAETSYAPDVSVNPEVSKKINNPPGDALEISPEMSYVEMNGFYVDGSLYQKIKEDKTDTVYDIMVFPYDSDEINDFVFEGNRYGDIFEKYSDAEIQYNILLDVMIYFEENENGSSGQSSAAYSGAVENETASGVLVVSPPYNDEFLQIVEGYKKDGKADTEKINAEKENLMAVIDELSNLVEKMRTAYNTQFAEKTKEEWIRCGIKNAEIRNDMCYIKATAAELKAFTPESKNTYALYEKIVYEQGAEVLE